MCRASTHKHAMCFFFVTVGGSTVEDQLEGGKTFVNILKVDGALDCTHAGHAGGTCAKFDVTGVQQNASSRAHHWPKRTFSHKNTQHAHTFAQTHVHTHIQTYTHTRTGTHTHAYVTTWLTPKWL